MENEKQEVNKQLNNISYSQEDVQVLPELLKAVITRIESKLAKEVFGEKSSRPEQSVITIYYENAELGFSGDQTINQYPKGKIPQKSKLGKIINRYNGLCVSKEISLLQSHDGYYHIVLD